MGGVDTQDQLVATVRMDAERHVILLMMAPTPVPVPVRTEGGTISGAVTWGPDFEHKVTTNLVIGSSDTLNILAGTVVKFEGVSLQVDGTLNAQGTPGQRVLLTSDTSWGGIKIVNASTNSVINYVVIENVAGTALDVTLGTLRLSNSVVRQSTQGLWIKSNAVNMFGNEIYSNDTGIITGERNSVNLRLSTVRDNKIGVSIVGPEGRLTLTSNNIRNNEEFNIVIVGVGSRNVDASENWWGTTDKAAIEKTIFHSIDDNSLKTVVFEPIATGPVSGAP